MDEAERHRAESEILKPASAEDAARRQAQAQYDDELVARGIDPKSADPRPTAAMARRLHALLEAAKRDGSIDAPVNFLHAKLDQTIQGFGDSFGGIPLACKKGCSYCCHVWISATAPEVLFIAKVLKARGGDVIERLATAHALTRDRDFNARGQHPLPCPLLEEDICSIYGARPNSCRLGVSGDAQICRRSIHEHSGEAIPTPQLYLRGKTVYAIAVAVALKWSNLPYNAYELNAALVRALDTRDAERAWLNGEDIFSDLMCDPGDVFANSRDAQMMFEHARGAGV